MFCFGPYISRASHTTSYIHVYLIEFVTITYTFRLIHSGQRSNPLTGADLITFGTRCGTRNGVEMHVKINKTSLRLFNMFCFGPYISRASHTTSDFFNKYSSPMWTVGIKQHSLTHWKYLSLIFLRLHVQLIYIHVYLIEFHIILIPCYMFYSGGTCTLTLCTPVNGNSNNVSVSYCCLCQIMAIFQLYYVENKLRSMRWW
jgi:hypothetical protein